MGNWWPIDNIRGNILSWIKIWDHLRKYVFTCKECGVEIYSLPTLKPICDNCTMKGVICETCK